MDGTWTATNVCATIGKRLAPGTVRPVCQQCHHCRNAVRCAFTGSCAYLMRLPVVMGGPTALENTGGWPPCSSLLRCWWAWESGRRLSRARKSRTKVIGTRTKGVGGLLRPSQFIILGLLLTSDLYSVFEASKYRHDNLECRHGMSELSNGCSCRQMKADGTQKRRRTIGGRTKTVLWIRSSKVVHWPPGTGVRVTADPYSGQCQPSGPCPLISRLLSRPTRP